MPAHYVKGKHDIGVLRADGSTKVGLLLARDKNGIPMWSTEIDEFLSQQQFEQQGYDALPYEKELAIIQDDWRGGYGLEVADRNNPIQYHYAQDMDLRFKGMAICAQAETTLTLPTLPSLTDGGLEIWTDVNTLTNWTKVVADAGNTLTREATIIYSGTYSAKLVTSADAADYVEINQTLGSWSNNFRNVTYTFTCWVKTANGSAIRLSIYDGVGTTNGSYHTGGNDWERLEVTRKLDAAATELTLKIRATQNGGAVTAYVDLVEVPVIAGATICRRWVEFDSDLFFGLGRCLFRIADADGACTFQGGLPNAITDLCVFSDDALYIAQGWSFAYWAMSSAEVFTKNTLASNTAKFFAFVNLAADTFYISDSAYTTRSTTNPADGGTAYSGQTVIGTSFYDITQLLAVENALYIMKTDMPYYLDSSGDVKVLTPTTKTIGGVGTSMDWGGENSVEWLGSIYMPYGKSLLEYHTVNTTLKWLPPNNGITPPSTSSTYGYGYGINSLMGDDEWLYATQYVSVSTYNLLAGRWETINNVTSWVWHPIGLLTSNSCTSMMISQIYQKRLWFNSGSIIKYIELTDDYSIPTTFTNRNFQTGGYFETPWYHAEYKGDPKSWIKLTVWMGHSYAAGVYFTISYKKWDDSSWTSIGNFVGTATSMIETKYIPVDASSNKPSSRMMKFKITGVTNSTSVTPILNRLDIRCVLYPTNRKIYNYVVRCADKMQAEGIEMPNAAYIRTVIEELQDATYPATIYDHYGNTITVKSLPIKPDSLPVRDEKGNHVETHYYLKLQKVTTS